MKVKSKNGLELGDCVDVLRSGNIPIERIKETYAISLPFPPSVNGYWRAVVRAGRPAQIISEKGRTFRGEAALVCLLYHVANIGLDGRLHVSIFLHRGDRRKYDVDNYGKAVLDALTHAGVWLDDEQVDKLTLTRGKITEKNEQGYALVLIREVDK